MSMPDNFEGGKSQKKKKKIDNHSDPPEYSDKQAVLPVRWAGVCQSTTLLPDDVHRKAQEESYAHNDRDDYLYGVPSCSLAVSVCVSLQRCSVMH